MRSLVRANQKPESPVRTRPLSGISVGRTTSKVEMRSLATSSRRSASSSNSSRTFPLPTWTADSDMNRFLLPDESGEPLEDGVDVTCVPAEIEDGVQVDAAGDLPVRANELAEVLFLLLGPQRVPLDEAVSGVALEPRLDQGEQQALTEEEPVAGLEVAQHPLRPDLEALDEPGEPLEHVVEREERVRDHNPLGRRVRDVALVPEGDILESNESIRPDHARQAAQPLGDNGVPLVRHRRRALLTLSERLGHLGHLGACQVSDLECEALQRGRDECERGQQLGLPVAWQNLRRDRLWLESQALAGEPLELGLGRCVRPDRAGKLPDAHPLERRPQAFPSAVELEGPARELEPERRRLCVNAVRSADANGQPVLLRALGGRTQRSLHALEQQLPG